MHENFKSKIITSIIEVDKIKTWLNKSKELRKYEAIPKQTPIRILGTKENSFESVILKDIKKPITRKIKAKVS